MLNRNRNTYAIQSVENALCILEAISEEQGDFGVSHLSAKLGMEKSYIFRMLATFKKRGYVRQEEPSGLYRAGLAAYETGGRFLNQLELLRKAKPIMESLAQASGEAVYLALLGDKDLLFIEMVDSPQQVRVMPLVGKRFSLQQVSAGKVILAHSTNRTKQEFRSLGNCVDQGVIDDGIGSLSVPVVNAQGDACASLCLVAPDFRLSEERTEAILLPLLQAAGEKLAARLGYINVELLQASS